MTQKKKDNFSWIKNGWEIANSIYADILLNTIDTDLLDEKKYLDFIKPNIPLFVSIENKKTVEEMAHQEEDLCKRILDEMDK